MGSIEVICGSMFSGKTEELIKRIQELHNTNLNYKVFKPEIDKRSGEKKFKLTTIKVLMQLILKNASEIINQANNCDVIAIDEAQFFSEDIVEVCNNLANKGIRVIIAGLDMDYLGKAFWTNAKINGNCRRCIKSSCNLYETGKPANYSFRKSNNNDTVMLGEKNEYEPLSQGSFCIKNEE